MSYSCQFLSLKVKFQPDPALANLTKQVCHKIFLHLHDQTAHRVLKRTRKAKQIPVEQLSKMTRIPEQAITRIEAGDTGQKHAWQTDICLRPSKTVSAVCLFMLNLHSGQACHIFIKKQIQTV